MLLTVVDYGVGNLRSISKSIEKANSDNNLNYSVKVSSDVNDVKKSDKIVLPGQGSFKACKNGINNIKGLKEELDESVCKWPVGHPEEKSFYFCGRSSLKDFSYCRLHLLYAYQPKGKKEDTIDKEEEVPQYIEKKTKTA